jgi:two-component system cell cycle sensor histidine kinase/response regulator CckA
MTLRPSLPKFFTARRQAGKLLGALAGACPLPIFALDPKGIVLWLNHAAEQAFGWTAEEIVGKPYPVIPDSERASFEQLLARTRRGESFRDLEVLRQKRDGSLTSVIAYTAPLRDARGRLIGTMAMLADLAERKRLEETRQWFAAIVESSDDAIIGKTLDGIITTWNRGAERIYGYTAAEAVGRSIKIVLPPDRATEMDEILSRVKARGHVDHFETVQVRKDGRRIDVSLTIFPVQDSAGRLLGASLIARDITARKHLEAQLRQAQKMEAVGRLAGGIAHDFNSLLAVILGDAELLLAHPALPQAVYTKMEEVKEAGQRAASLVRQLLAFARRQEQAPGPLDLNAALADMEGMLRRLAGESIEFSLALESGLGPVGVDSSDLLQVVLNLVANARDAMPAGGRLSIGTSNLILDEASARALPGLRPGPHVLLTVSDSGAGMDAETLAHMFEPFFTTKEPGRGTGIGLATVYGIVRRAGGAVSVWSEPGKGTTLRIHLPRVEAEAVASSSEPSASAGPILRGSGTILIVEDSRLLRRVTREFLERAGYRVVLAASPAEAIQAARSHFGSIDLVLTDVVLPEMSGPELVRRLLAEHPSLRVLYMSGYADDVLAKAGLSRLSAPFIDKPFTGQALAEKVRQVLTAARP